jgi:hypothetical protein
MEWRDEIGFARETDLQALFCQTHTLFVALAESN